MNVAAPLTRDEIERIKATQEEIRRRLEMAELEYQAQLRGGG